MSLSRTILATVARQVFATVLRLGFVVLSARLLGPSANGLYALAMLLPSLLTAGLNLGVPTANVYFVASGTLDLASASRLSARVWGLLSLVGLGAVGLCVLCSDLILPGVRKDVIALAGLLFPVTLGTAFVAGLLQARKDYTGFNRALSVAPLLSLGILASAYLLFGAQVSILRLVNVQLVSETAALVYALQRLRPQLGEPARAQAGASLKQLLTFGGVLHVGTLLMQLSYRLDLVLVNAYLGASAAGVYYVGVRITEQIWVASQPISAVLLPEFAARHKSDPTEQVYTSSLAVRLALYSALALGVALASLAQPVIGGLFGEAYTEAAVLVRWLLPGALLLNGARIACVALSARGRPELTLHMNLAVLISSVALNLLLIPRLHLRGAACATSLAYVIGTVVAIRSLAGVNNQSLRALLTPTARDMSLLRSLWSR